MYLSLSLARRTQTLADRRTRTRWPTGRETTLEPAYTSAVSYSNYLISKTYPFGMGSVVRRGVAVAAILWMAMLLLLLLSSPRAVEARVVGGRRAQLSRSYFDALLELLPKGDTDSTSGSSGCTLGSYRNGRPCKP